MDGYGNVCSGSLDRSLFFFCIVLLCMVFLESDVFMGVREMMGCVGHLCECVHLY